MSLATCLLLTPLCFAQAPTPRPLPPPPAKELPAAPVENLTTIDPMGVRLEWKEGRWQLFHAEQLLKDFGNRNLEARQAHTLIRDLRLTQRGTIGGDQTVMEYWLSGGQAPAGRTWGMKTVSFANETLEVEKVRNEWCVRDAKQVVMAFGKREDLARQTLAVLQKYGFNQAGIVGNAAPLMVVLLRQQQTGGGMSTGRVQPLKFATNSMRKPAPITPQQQGKIDAATLAAMPPTPLIPALVTPGAGLKPPGMIQQVGYKPAQQPAAPVEPVEPLLFDWQNAQPVRDNGDWKLQVGNQLLGNFGLSEPDAKLAHAAAHFYRFTEYQRFGKGEPALGYFLCSGQAPRGLMAGLNGEAFQPELVTLRQLKMRWVLTQGQRVIADCGQNADDAEALLQAIRKHRFDAICHIGQGEGALTFFVKCR